VISAPTVAATASTASSIRRQNHRGTLHPNSCVTIVRIVRAATLSSVSCATRAFCYVGLRGKTRSRPLRGRRNVVLPGQYYDSEAGLFYNGYRDYDPALGRDVESDPIGLAGGINTYAYVDDMPTMEYDANGLEAVSYLLHHPPAAPTPSPPNVPPDVKKVLCDTIKKCAGNMDCVYSSLNRQRRDPLWPGGPANPDGKAWNDPTLRQAENFATAAADNSVDYTMSWAAHNTPGIWSYQYVVKRLKHDTTPVSDDAYQAGNAGAYFYGRPPSEALKWCDSCSSH
jgi:RHS repeat-associated protein